MWAIVRFELWNCLIDGKFIQAKNWMNEKFLGRDTDIVYTHTRHFFFWRETKFDIGKISISILLYTSLLSVDWVWKYL